MRNLFSRRSILALSAAIASLGSRAAHAATPTPSATEGPFYPPPRMRPADTDWDLVKIEGVVREAGGQIVWLDGDVRDQSGAPVAGALVEIWQCDVNGRYHHDADRGAGRPLDEAFQGYGAVETDDAGRYRFRTIKPVAYPGRTPHIHAKITPPGGRTLTTQIYLEDEPKNQRDFIFRALGKAGQEAATFQLTPQGDGSLRGVFTFVV